MRQALRLVGCRYIMEEPAGFCSKCFGELCLGVDSVGATFLDKRADFHLVVFWCHAVLSLSHR